MKYKTILEIGESKKNGNISYFKEKVKRMSKLDILNAIEIWHFNRIMSRHQSITYLAIALEK